MIVLQFDGRYHSWGSVLLRSLARHEPGRAVLADTVNLTADQQMELRRAHPGATIHAHRLSPPPTPWEMANRKPYVFRDAIARFPGEPWYALLDADLLVRRPLPDLWDVMERAPLGLIQTDGTFDGRFAAGQVFNSSVVLVRHDAIAFVDGWCRWTAHDRPLGGVEPGRWFWDQLTLLMSWCDNPQLESVRLPWDLYADWRLSHAAAIWSAHVPAAWKAPYLHRFQLELERMSECVANR